MIKTKRIIIFILMIALCTSLVTVAYAKSNNHGKGNDKDEESEVVLSEDVQILKTLGILIGTGKDGLSLEYTKSKPTRMQGFVIYLRLINQELDLNQFTYHEGDDTFDDHHGHSDYAKKVMAYAKAHPELNWVGSNGKFNPMAHLTAKEFAKIMLVALGYKYNEDFTWKNVESFAEGLGLNVPKGAFTINVLATMTVQTLNMTMNGTSQKLIDYLASVNPEFAEKVAELGDITDNDETKPSVTDVVLSTPYTAGPPVVNGQVTIYFSEAMKADTLTSLTNYSVDIDGSGPVLSVQLSQMTGATAVAAADKKSVTLTIPDSALAGGTAAGSGITDVTISGLTDLTGNAIDTVTQYVRKAAALTVTSCAAIDLNKLQVTFVNPMKTVNPAEFKLYRADGYTPAFAGTSYTVDNTGKIVTITLSGKLTATAKAAEADLTTAKLVIGTANTADIFGNAVSGAVVVPDVSAVTPATVVILDKIAPSVASLTKGAEANTFEMTFTEPVNAVNLDTLTAALRIKNASGVAQTATYAFSGAAGTITDFTKLTATITGGTDSKYTIELLAQGLKDISGNTVKALAKTTLTVQASGAPVITARETQDLDKDGYLDAVKLTFSESIKDSTVNANNFDVAGYSYEVFYPGTAGDAADNNVIYITFLESGTVDTGATPTISYTQGTLADLTGDKLATTSALATTDKAAPVVMTSLPVGVLTAGGPVSSATLVLSEDITAANQETILAAVRAHIAINDVVTFGDIVKAEVWTTNKTLTVTITGNVNAVGESPDSISLSAVLANLVDASGNSTADAPIIKLVA